MKPIDRTCQALLIAAKKQGQSTDRLEAEDFKNTKLTGPINPILKPKRNKLRLELIGQ